MPSIIRMVTSACPRKPIQTATGRNTIGRPTSLMNDAAEVGTIFLNALAPSKLAPILSRASGVAQFASASSVLATMAGNSTCRKENGSDQDAEDDGVGDYAVKRAARKPLF